MANCVHTLNGTVTITKLNNGDVIDRTIIQNMVVSTGLGLLGAGYPINAVRYGSSTDSTDFEHTDVVDFIGQLHRDDQSGIWYDIKAIERNSNIIAVEHMYKFLLGQTPLEGEINEVSFGYVDEENNFTAFNRVVLNDPMSKNDSEYLLFEYKLTVNLIPEPVVLDNYVDGNNSHTIYISTVAFDLDSMRLDNPARLNEGEINVYELDPYSTLNMESLLTEDGVVKLAQDDFIINNYEPGSGEFHLEINKPADPNNPILVGTVVIEYLLGNLQYHIDPPIVIPANQSPTLHFLYSWGNVY